MASLILFDCDGTLTNSNGIIIKAVREAFEDHGLQPPSKSVVLAALGMSLNAVIEGLLDRQGIVGADVEVIAEAYRQHYVADEVTIELYPDVLETLQKLKDRGYWMAIVTGKSKLGLDRVRARFHLDDYFHAWRTADCCHSKPHPAMALECMAELGVDAADTALVGDARFDIQMAKAAGVRALGASFDMLDGQVLYDEGAEAVVHRFDDLLRYFPSLA